jgi:hypothetical protein
VHRVRTARRLTERLCTRTRNYLGATHTRARTQRVRTLYAASGSGASGEKLPPSLASCVGVHEMSRTQTRHDTYRHSRQRSATLCVHADHHRHTHITRISNAPQPRHRPAPAPPQRKARARWRTEQAAQRERRAGGSWCQRGASSSAQRRSRRCGCCALACAATCDQCTHTASSHAHLAYHHSEHQNQA